MLETVPGSAFRDMADIYVISTAYYRQCQFAHLFAVSAELGEASYPIPIC